MSEPEPYYPAWLGRGLLDETIRGVPGVGTTFEAFLDAYTLHDSIWIALVVHPGHADLIVRLDAHWSQGRVPDPGPVVAAWPILVVTMEGSVEARSDGLMSGHIASAASGPHPDDDRLARTTLEGDGGSVELVHRRAVQLRCFARDGAALAIPLG